MQAILAGTDPVAVDTVACIAMNYEPKTIGHLVFASAVDWGTRIQKRLKSEGRASKLSSRISPIPVAGSCIGRVVMDNVLDFSL